MGIGGIQGSILGNLIPDSYGPYYYNDDDIFYPRPSDNKLIVQNVATGIKRVVSSIPANSYKANGNNWATWTNPSSIPGTGLIASNFHLVDAGLLDIGPDGAVGFTSSYQVGLGCDVIELSGERWMLSLSGVIWDLQLLGNKKAIWRDAEFKIQTFGIPSCVQVGRAFKPKAVFTNGEWWVSYWSTSRGLILHPFNSTKGYVIHDGDAFNNVANANGPFINVAWSVTEGEGPQDYRNMTFNIDTAPRHELGGSAPVPVPENEVMIPAFERPMWMAPFFSYHTRYGDTNPEVYTGNSIIQLKDDTNPGRFPGFGMPLIVELDSPQWDPNLCVAYWVSGAHVNSLQGEVNRALALPEKPVIGYLDSRDWPDVNPFTSDRVWPGIQCYRGGNESLNDFEDAMIAVFDKVRNYGLPIVLVDRFDDYNGSSTIDRTIECMPFYELLMREYPIVAHLPFADRRGNGIASNPRLWDWARAFQYAIPFGRPNRFDYWRPSGLSNKEILENKFGQTRASIVLEPYLRADILRRYL